MNETRTAPFVFFALPPFAFFALPPPAAAFGLSLPYACEQHDEHTHGGRKV